ncbi:MAG: hypothetical protein RhofKO_21890 [Rhodothermales bacterium]
MHASLAVVFALVALGFGCEAGSSPDPEPEIATVIDGLFAPPAGQTLLIIGQDLTSIADYTANLALAPGGVTTYTDISEGGSPLLNGLENDANWGAGPINAAKNLQADPNAVLAIGLHLVDNTGTNLANIANGTHNDAIDRLGRFIQHADRPVFLRIGYEFDGPWNHYEPGPYQAAFRRIVDQLRAQGVTNFATVWQSATSKAGTYNNHPIEVWYPGDAYVDWMGTSFFEYEEAIYARFLAFARARNKPVMIAEATPQGYSVSNETYSAPGDGQTFVPKTASAIWGEWYAPFFDLIHTNADVIRAVAYINADWHSQAMWGPNGGNGYWGDSRVHVDPTIRERWLSEINQPFWLHASPDLFATLGYAD